MNRKLGGSAPFSCDPSNTTSPGRLGQDLPLYQVASWFIQAFGHKICNHFGDIAAWSLKSLKTVAQKLPFWTKKKSPYGANFQFRKDSWRHRSTSCAQISWNLADRKSAKSCVIYLTKKISTHSPFSLLHGSRPKSVRASFRQYTQSAPNFIWIRTLPAEL